MFFHFEAQYKVANVMRPSGEKLSFRTLSYIKDVTLLKSFTLEEVKAAIWDCGSNKASSPDCVSLGFIEDFLVELKKDIMCFATEFHRNGKLTKLFFHIHCSNSQGR